MQIKVKNNHQTKTISRCGFDFKPQKVSDSLEVTDHQLFQIKVVKYLEVEEIKDNLEDNKEEVVDERIDLTDKLVELNMEELNELAKELGMVGYSKLNKAPLVEQIMVKNNESEIILGLDKLE